MTPRAAAPCRANAVAVLGNVQALRALAALLVVVVHAYAIESTYLPGRPWTSPFHVFGTYGVDLFFVISGTVMVASTDGWFAAPGSWRRFLWRRATRIYPPYWIVTAIALAVFIAAPAVAGAHRSAPPNVIASFLALPQWGEPLLVVGWTLVYEIAFYCVFAFALLFRRRWLPVITLVWLAAIVALHLTGSADPWVRVLGSPFNLEFVFGMLIGAAVLRDTFVMPRVLTAVAIALVIATCIATAVSGREYDVVTWWRPLLVGVPMALLVYAGIGLERRGLYCAPRALRIQGDASYSLYLWHVLVLGGLGYVLNRIHLHGIPARICIIAGGYALSIAVSLAAYRWIEKPILRLMSSRA